MNGRGFTLIEMIMVIVLMGAMTLLAGPLLIQPFKHYFSSQSRLALAQEAELLSQQIELALDASVPNSYRLLGDHSLEWLSLDRHSGPSYGLYRHQDSPWGEGLNLAADWQFDALGSLSQSPTSSLRMVVHPLGQGVLDAWQQSTDQGPLAMIAELQPQILCDCGDCNLCPVTRVCLRQNCASGSPSLHQFTEYGAWPMGTRFYLSTGPAGLSCSDQGLKLYQGYASVDAGQSLEMRASAQGALLSPWVSECQMQLYPGNSLRPPQFELRLQLQSPEGESLSLIYQRALSHAP